MRDDGWCLTMHQPWASYLISGIKMHEGRTWYSSHRGRLWIHAAAKVPTEDEIKAVQASYSGVPRDFPKILPVSCLLGMTIQVLNLVLNFVKLQLIKSQRIFHLLIF